MSQKATRLSSSAFSLLRDAIGGSDNVASKIRNIGGTARLYWNRHEIERRFDCLEERGFMLRRPSRGQLFVGSLDMLRFLITPAAGDYYAAMGISFGFHQLLRVLDDPVSMIDPTGIYSMPDTIIGHLMQVVHLNPVFDFQLLQMFPDGLDNLDAQLRAMIAGTHPRSRTIGAIVEDTGYHARLLGYLERYRKDPNTPHMVRAEQSIRDRDEFRPIERTFATVPGFLNYCCHLPQKSWGLLKHVIQGKFHEPSSLN